MRRYSDADYEEDYGDWSEVSTWWPVATTNKERTLLHGIGLPWLCTRHVVHRHLRRPPAPQSSFRIHQDATDRAHNSMVPSLHGVVLAPWSCVQSTMEHLPNTHRSRLRNLCGPQDEADGGGGREVLDQVRHRHRLSCFHGLSKTVPVLAGWPAAPARHRRRALRQRRGAAGCPARGWVGRAAGGGARPAGDARCELHNSNSTFIMWSSNFNGRMCCSFLLSFSSYVSSFSKTSVRTRCWFLHRRRGWASGAG